MNVIIADDDPTMLALIRAVVEQGGHTVVAAVRDGEAAWEAFHAENVPLIILDWEMPKLDGLGLCRRIRSAENIDPPFILIVTGRKTRDDLLKALDAGADDYLAKPVTPDDFAARLRIVERRIQITGARRQAEMELRRARYLAGIGETSLALQHEINNPLAAMLSHAALLEAGMVEDSEKDEALNTIVAQAKRIGDVVKRLRQIEQPRSVEYLGNARMLDIGPAGGPSSGAPGTPGSPGTPGTPNK
jgi:DNA-binding response OmpR family regulator